MQKIVIFGTGELAQRIFYYLKDSNDEVVAFSANKSNIDSNELLGLPVIAFEDIKEKYPPEKFSMFIALAYSEMNKKRTKFFDEAKVRVMNCIVLFIHQQRFGMNLKWEKIVSFLQRILFNHL